jgi:hypothetical protein
MNRARSSYLYMESVGAPQTERYMSAFGNDDPDVGSGQAVRWRDTATRDHLLLFQTRTVWPFGRLIRGQYGDTHCS